MKVAIVGSRDFPKLNLVREYINNLPQDTIIVSGGARGVDRVAENHAIAIGLKTEVYLADWDKHGKAAGFLRNQTIVDVADVVVAFWDGKSRGTLDTIIKTENARKPLQVIKA